MPRSEREKPKVLVIEDEEGHQNLLNYLLSRRYEVYMAGTASEGLSIPQQTQPDLILLDLHLPDGCGLKLCSKFRENPKTARVPILILTGDDLVENRIAAFTSGADDFISKPFVPAELVARIECRLKRSRGHAQVATGGIQARNVAGKLCGNLELQPATMSVNVSGTLIQLSTLEFRLLSYFLANPESVHSREQILRSVWKNTTVAPRTVDTHVSILRRKLKQFDHEIVGLYGAGYSLRKRESGFLQQPIQRASGSRN